MSRTTTTRNLTAAIPEGVALALLLATLGLELWDVWREWRAPTAEPITVLGCWGFSCECFPSPEP